MLLLGEQLRFYEARIRLPFVYLVDDNDAPLQTTSFTDPMKIRL